MSGPDDPRRRLPRADAVLAQLADLDLHPAVVKRAVDAALDAARSGAVAPEAVAAHARTLVPATLRPVLNATGVVVHTNLGRAPLGATAVAALTAAAGYVDVEFDVATGARARRGRGMLDALLARVPAAQDALVVTNGAAALVLAATALAQGREMVVSRGELVEIGDGFRLPDLLASTGARLREVGTTNRTTPADYRAALGPDTGFVLKIHPSNFTVSGFTSSVGVRELAGLGVPVVADIGSGLLTPSALLPDEPDATTWLRAGATLVTASADKLLGGPQAGLVLGSRDVVQALRRHPLARAVRADKLTIAALEATLTAPSTPVERALTADTRERTERLAAALDPVAEVVPSAGLVGGGGAPGVQLPGWAVRLPAPFASVLRTGEPCVVGRVEDGHCLIDLRCVPPEQDELLLGALRAATEVVRGCT